VLVATTVRPPGRSAPSCFRTWLRPPLGSREAPTHVLPALSLLSVYGENGLEPGTPGFAGGGSFVSNSQKVPANRLLLTRVFLRSARTRSAQFPEVSGVIGTTQRTFVPMDRRGRASPRRLPRRGSRARGGQLGHAASRHIDVRTDLLLHRPDAGVRRTRCAGAGLTVSGIGLDKVGDRADDSADDT